MSHTKKAIRFSMISLLVLGSAVAAVGCSAETGQGEASSVASEALATGNNFFGSDTLKPVVAAAVSIYPSLTYAGSGSGNGEACLRGAAPCSPNAELSAPMSRDIAGSCTTGTDAIKTKRIGRDGILALTATSNSETNITTANLALAFCSAPVPPAGSCASPLVINGVTYNKFYRRDDASGTTDTLKTQLGCTALCNDANHIVINASNLPAPCTSTDTDTQCIAKLVASNTGAGTGQFVLGYAGLSARTAGSPAPAKELTVNGVAATDANVRSGSYPLSRFLYVNYNQSMLSRVTASGPSATNATLSEKKFLCENVLGPSTSGCPTGLVDRRTAFENSLVSVGDFLKCSTTGGVFNCSTTGETCP